MYEINHAHLESVIDDKHNRDIKAIDCDATMMQFVYTESNTLEEVSAKFDKYQLALWVKSKKVYLDKRAIQVSTKYYPRQIVLVDLGFNISGELSYEHPCVVIRNNYDKVFIVPCSSSKLKRAYDKNGKIFPEYIKGTSKDGFTYSTALMIDNAKWISKSRIIKKYETKVTPEFFNILYNKVFEYLFESKQHQIQKQQNIINELRNKIEKLEREKSLLTQQSLDGMPKIVKVNAG